MSQSQSVLVALQQFAEQVTAKFGGLAAGEPEDQLRAPIEGLLTAVGKVLNWQVVPKGESRLEGALGRPDYAVLVDRLLAGYIELKEPGAGANAPAFKGRNQKQWRRFSLLPNILYTDGNEWRLFRNGKLVGWPVRLAGDVARDGRNAASPDDAERLLALLRDFLGWAPIIPRKARELAELLAPLCRMLRQEVVDTLGDPHSALAKLQADWRDLLFPEADPERFADAYAQTVTFAMLMGLVEEAVPSDDSTLLAQALHYLTVKRVRDELGPSLAVLERVVEVIRSEESLFHKSESGDPWLYFYEDFLAAYDPDLRRDAGAYYTPVEVVHAQARLIHCLLAEELGCPLGFADPGVVTLDPAAGTGTYLLGVVEQAAQTVVEAEGDKAVAAKESSLAERLYGFEILVGPYSVAQLRLSRALLDHGASLPREGPRVFLTDTLESPNASSHYAGLMLERIAEQHARALDLKKRTPVLVCLGNPPYDRHKGVDGADVEARARAGSWVRWGDTGAPDDAILRDFVNPAKAAGHGGDIKNLYNLYVYFWRWALWKVFEHDTASGPGIVSFISASSYLDGDAFVGMREHLRRLCDDVWILDLGGEGRGTRKSDNVFAIQTPVAVAVAYRGGKPRRDRPARVRYFEITGTRKEKLATLEQIDSFRKVKWRDCPTGWQAPFRPAGIGDYFDWPLLTELLPWQHSGAEVKRTWPIAPNAATLQRRWRALLRAKDRELAFKPTRDRSLDAAPSDLFDAARKMRPIGELGPRAEAPRIEPYGFRAFDRQWVFADTRVGDFLRPVLWRAHSERQVYLSSSFALPVGAGPAAVASAHLPDRHYFCGRGGKDVVPLYRDARGRQPNVNLRALGALAEEFGRDVRGEALFAYLYALLAQPAYTDKFHHELLNREIRVPITTDARLFERVAEKGRWLLWLHTYGERFAGKGRPRNRIPRGAARCAAAMPEDPDAYPTEFKYDPARQRLLVGSGEFGPVSQSVWDFEVSGLKVVASWLGYRMKDRRGRKSSPLDDIGPERWTAEFTTELLQLLWVLEATLGQYPEQAALLESVLESELLPAKRLLAGSAAWMPPPNGGNQGTLF